MKCSVCAQDIPEDRYSEHLESEHGVTDDPTAVLIQHLTALRSTAGDADGDEGLPDEEPSDADAFEQFLAAHPEKPEAKERETGEPEPEPEPERKPAEGVGEEPTAETAITEAAAAKSAASKAAATKAGTKAADTKAAATKAADTKAVAGDEETFAVWDEARGTTAADEDLVVVAPAPSVERARRRRQVALLGLAAAIILVAVAVIYLLTRSTGAKKTTTTAPVTSPPTTPAPTFLPGARGGAPTTVAAPTPFVPPATTATPATTPTTAAPPTTSAGDPKSKIAFSYSGAECTPSGGLTVFGTITNTNPATYTFTYTIVVVRADGTQQGTANGSVSHLPPGGHFGPGPIGTGSCTYPLSPGPNPRQTITSITPG